MLSLSLTLSFFIYTLSFILFTLFTLYSPLYSSFNTPGYPGLLGLLGLLICQPPGIYHYLPYSSHLYPSSLPLLAHGWLHLPLLALLIILHLSFPLFWGSHYFPYSSSCISIYSCLYSAPKIYSLISFPLPTYLLYSTHPYIFQITYLLHFLNSPLYILPYSHFPYLSRPYPILHILTHITSLTCLPFIHFFITSKLYLPLYSQPN